MTSNLHPLSDLAVDYLSENQAESLKRVYCKVITDNDPESDDCWVCASHSDKSNGYPRMRDPYSHLMVPIQRVIWEFIAGPIPEDQVVTRTCGNKSCCNPAHLKLRNKEETLEYLNEKAKAEAAAKAA